MRDAKRKVFIIEPQALVRASIASIVEDLEGFVILGTYMNMDSALHDVDRGSKPDVILTEIAMEGRDGIAGTREMLRKLPNSTVVIISEVDSSPLLFKALRAGVTGYILKSQNYLNIAAALSELDQGGAPMSPGIALKLVKYFHGEKNGHLTGREQEVLKLMTEGNTYSQISKALNLSKATIKTHQRNIYSKLKLHNKSKIIQFAIENNLV